MAINLSQAILHGLCIHMVGNNLQNEGIRLSTEAIVIDDENIRTLILKYFLSAFKNTPFFNLHHEEDLVQNKVFEYASTIFENGDNLLMQSQNLAHLLYEKSIHPRITGGELYVVKLSDCFVDDEVVDAVGIFKSESKETFLKVYPAGDNYEIDCEQGININKLDKGCLIFNTEKEMGYKVCLIDNKSDEARYWKEDFIGAKPREDNFYYTENYMKMCKNFFNDKLKEEFKTDRVDEVSFLNKSSKFFEEKEVFDVEQFKQEVIQQPEIFDLFDEYKEKYQEENEAKITDEFNISQPAVKNYKKIFKSVIKLDKNFHIYVHGNRELIEKGIDPVTGMNFYRLMFKSEF